MNDTPKLGAEFTVREVRAILKFLRRMETHAESGISQAREAAKLADNEYTRNQLAYWKRTKSAMRWAAGLLKTAYPNR